MMLKKSLFIVLFIVLNFCVFAQTKVRAKDIASQSVNKSSVNESIEFIKANINSCQTQSDKRSLYIFLASLQEELALYEDARKNYAAAAGISASDAEGMPKKSNEQLVLDAVRCCLCMGDSDTADQYLNSAVRNSKDSVISSYVKLYTQWSALCRANSAQDLQEPVELLKAYLKVSSMKSVHPVILLTLWYVTADDSYSKQLNQDFPSSTEASIIKGDAQLLPVPFWFFVPKSGIAEMGSGSYSQNVFVSTENDDKNQSSSSAKFTKWQLGLFKTESNAKLLSEELKTKGFNAYVSTEKRSSGTTYFIVLVNETAEGNVSDRLRSAGYDCYPVE